MQNAMSTAGKNEEWNSAVAGTRARLLIVDDETPQMKALCNTLHDHGFEPTGFSEARAALAELRKNRFDLLLTDLMMPDMDGIAVLRAAQEIDPQIVGVVMTGHGTIDTAVEAMKAGALDYILKPFKLSAILPVLSRALAVRRLRNENEELQRRVRARTEQLEAANKELEAFSYSVSHDLRAPLRSIRAFTEILVQEHGGQLTPEAREITDRITVNAARMGKLIEDLLAFSRFTRQSLNRQPVDMEAVVSDVLDEIKKTHEGREVAVSIGALPACQGDPALLRQVWMNLLSNAFKFTRHKEEPRVEVGSTEGPEEVVYFVRDNGAGFDMQYAQRLFGVFQRLHSADEFEGTGIGLSIVQRIIKRHGGRVWAEAEEGRGATFFFSIPRALAPDQAKQEASK